jgi:hypothetical protein
MIRTELDLIARIAEDIVWRRKELTDLRGMVQDYSGQLRSKVLMRCAISLLYAHWEGFVKKSSSYYLEYVASHRLSYKKLSPNFIGMSLKAKYSELGVSKKLSAGNDLAEFFCFGLDRKSNLPYKTGVDTKSNLTSEVLLDIMSSLGLDNSPFLLLLQFIDKNLVNKRNHIAHGETLDIEIAEYLEIHDKVLSLIESYRTQLENASTLKLYQR